MEFLFEYGLFLAKAVTVVLAFGVALLFIAVFAMRNSGGGDEKGELHISNLSEKLAELKQTLQEEILSKEQLKKVAQQEKQRLKERKKETEARKRLFVINFKGDMQASTVESLAQEITAVLSIAEPNKDEVLVKVESPGGVVHGYGLAASQLKRIREKNIHLVVAVDKIAASGGYLMACVAHKIIAAPFAIIGSIGVLAQLPNFHRFLKKHDIDYEQFTAGEYKSTISMFAENTDFGREKFKQDLEDTHQLFKNFVAIHRPHVDVHEVATGEYWLAIRAKELALVDEIKTSDDYILAESQNADIFQLSYAQKKGLKDRLGLFLQSSSLAILEWLQQFKRVA